MKAWGLWSVITYVAIKCHSTIYRSYNLHYTQNNTQNKQLKFSSPCIMRKHGAFDRSSCRSQQMLQHCIQSTIHINNKQYTINIFISLHNVKARGLWPVITYVAIKCHSTIYRSYNLHYTQNNTQNKQSKIHEKSPLCKSWKTLCIKEIFSMIFCLSVDFFLFKFILFIKKPFQ